MKPRDYQLECIKSIWDFYRLNKTGNPLICVSTGGGKSYICALLIESIKKVKPDFKFLILSHVKEIVEQNAQELQRLIPSEIIGVYSAGLKSKTKRNITFASIQSVFRKPEIFFDTGMLIIDEAHLISQNDNSMYQKFISEINHPKLKILGMTATPMRMDQGSLISEGSLFTDIIYDVSVRNLINQGYLSKLISKSKECVDLTEVKTSGHDFNSIDLEIAFLKNQLIKEHIKQIIEQGKDRKSWLLFCSGIEHAKKVSEELKEQGVEADYITGEMIAFERDKKINDFKSGKIKALCNVNVLTTGFNHKGVDLIALLRATRSASLYIQMVGRGLRTIEGKENCLVLDFGGNIDRHGPIDVITIKKGKAKKAEMGTPPVKKCPECDSVWLIKTKICECCGYEFSSDSMIDLTRKAESEKSIISQVEKYKVNGFRVLLHEKPDKPQMIKIQYYTPAGMFSDFLCFNHGGYSTQIAKKKWIEKGGLVPAPSCTEIAYERQDELLGVTEIEVIKKGKYYEILKCCLNTKKNDDFSGDLVNI